MQLKIENGPFNGTEFQKSDTYESYNDDGISRSNVVLAKLTQMFLSVFSPIEGWAVTISGELEKLDLVPLNYERSDHAPQHVPTAIFTAKLINPTGVVVATASTLWTIDGPTAWEKGETNARTRLYEAVGLQSKFSSDFGASSNTTRAKLHAVPAVEQRRVVVKPAEPEPDATSKMDEAKVDEVKQAASQESKEVAEAPSNDETPDAAKPVVESEPSHQGEISLDGDLDPEAPPAAMLSQIDRLAKLMGKTVPTLKTRAEATDYLKRLQKGEA